MNRNLSNQKANPALKPKREINEYYNRKKTMIYDIFYWQNQHITAFGHNNFIKQTWHIQNKQAYRKHKTHFKYFQEITKCPRQTIT